MTVPRSKHAGLVLTYARASRACVRRKSSRGGSLKCIYLVRTPSFRTIHYPASTSSIHIQQLHPTAASAPSTGNHHWHPASTNSTDIEYRKSIMSTPASSAIVSIIRKHPRTTGYPHHNWVLPEDTIGHLISHLQQEMQGAIDLNEVLEEYVKLLVEKEEVYKTKIKNSKIDLVRRACESYVITFKDLRKWCEYLELTLELREDHLMNTVRLRLLSVMSDSRLC